MTIHMKYQAYLIFEKNNKNGKCCMLQILDGNLCKKMKVKSSANGYLFICSILDHLVTLTTVCLWRILHHLISLPRQSLLAWI